MPTEERPSAIELVRLLRQDLEKLPASYREDDTAVDALHRRGKMILTQLFGEGSAHLKDFLSISFSSPVVLFPTTLERRGKSQHQLDQEWYVRGRHSARNLLDVIEEELRVFGHERPQETTEAIQRVLGIFRHFHVVARAINSKRRHGHRPSLDVQDEYDVQDLLRALLRVDFEDVREEEYTPSLAGKSSRIDFLVKEEKIAVETKMTRDGLQEKEIGTELIDDIARYREHPSCKALLCLVYDPSERISNPASLERDLSGTKDGLIVHVFVVPKGK